MTTADTCPSCDAPLIALAEKAWICGSYYTSEYGDYISAMCKHATKWRELALGSAEEMKRLTHERSDLEAHRDTLLVDLSNMRQQLVDLVERFPRVRKPI